MLGQIHGYRAHSYMGLLQETVGDIKIRLHMYLESWRVTCFNDMFSKPTWEG